MSYLTGNSLRLWLKWILILALIVAFVVISARAGKITANCPVEKVPETATVEKEIYTFGSSPEEIAGEDSKIEKDEDDIFNEF